MTDLKPGVHEFRLADFFALIRQYDCFVVGVDNGSGSFLKMRCPSRWVKLAKDDFGRDYLTCRNKRKKDGHVFEIHDNKLIYNVEYSGKYLTGKLKTELCSDELVVTLWDWDDGEEPDEE